MSNSRKAAQNGRMPALLLAKHGTLDNVLLGTVAIPSPATGEVLVRVKAAALNRLDLFVAAGWPGLKLTLPHILGSDAAGVVEAVGADAGDFVPGDRVAVNPTISCGFCEFCRAGRDNLCSSVSVLGEHRPGTYAQFLTIPARNLLRLPDHVSYETAAAAALVYVTAWHSLITRGNLRPGESVLIVGAGGGVNTAAIQVARLAGAGPIIVVGSSAKKLAMARVLGADVLINRHEEAWGRAVYRATNRQGVDVVVDNVGDATFPDSLRALKRGGRLLTVGNSSGPKVDLDNRYLFAKHLSIIGSTMGPVADFETVMGLVFDGLLRVVIDTVYPLSEGVTALQRLSEGDVTGKLVLQP